MKDCITITNVNGVFEVRLGDMCAFHPYSTHLYRVVALGQFSNPNIIIVCEKNNDQVSKDGALLVWVSVHTNNVT